MTQIILDSTTQKNVDLWLNGHYDDETKATIRKLLRDNPKEAVEAFYTTLSFGTGGLRGLMGVGTNRMNRYTVGAATQGLANYLNKQKISGERSVFIGYDSRHNSRLFAEEAAKVLAGNGIRAFICSDIRPTPLVSFGCRQKKCSAAIMITASHNPPEYNGYKVYWNDGGQVLPPHDIGIIAEVNLITDAAMVKMVESLDSPLIQDVGTEIDEAYLDAITSLQLYPKENHKHGKKLSIVYTSLHGTGITMMPQALQRWGFNNLAFVENQVIPDSNFPTVRYPNPEEKEALKLGIQKLAKTGGDILIATDPDADRVGVAILHKGKVELLTGNQLASICLEHICHALEAQGRLSKKAAFIKTIGTTELFKTIAEAYHRPCFNTLTGFKYIAEMIHQWENNPQGYEYIFGGEESYGYLLGTVVRDKDGISSAALICEVALHAKLQGKTLIDLLHDIYRKYGFFFEKLYTMNFPETKAAREQMREKVEALEKKPPKQIGGMDVASMEDYKRLLKTDLKSGKTEAITLPKSDALLFWMTDGSKVMIRPSGTEPKIKVYCGTFQKHFSSLEEAQSICEKRTDLFFTSLNSY